MNDKANITYRGVTLRLHPGSLHKHHKLLRTAGACRDAYNEMLGRHKEQYAAYKAGTAKKPKPSYFALRDQAKLYSQEAPWRGAVAVGLVCNAMKPLAEAFTQFLAGVGYPNFKTTPTIYMFQRVNIRQGNRLHIPMVGRIKLTGQNPYSGCKAKNATLQYEAGHGYITILYEVPATRPAKPGNPVGIDRNVGQYVLPELKKLDAKLRRLQRKRAWQQYQRKSQSEYHCRECGMEKNADVNAAVNIRDKGLAALTASGDGATAGGGSSMSWPVKPEQVVTDALGGSFYIVTLD